MREDEISVGRAEDLTGKIFGEWTVLYRVKAPENLKIKKQVYWKCRCSCGKESVIKSANLKLGKSTKCKSCATKNQDRNCLIKDLSGQRFGKLIVIKPTKERSGSSVKWLCQCDCGRIIKVSSINLQSGHTTSCGCLKIKDMTSYENDDLKVLERAGLNSRGYTRWKCLCKHCGNTFVASGQNIRSGSTRSCGCLISRGELQIKQILNSYNIKYEAQKSFETCRFLDTKALARFDFYIPDKNYLIEFDGEQHFKYTSGWNTEENYLKVKEHDDFKNKWCKENDIPLIRIPYTKLETLCLEDLQPETSLFVV